MARNSSVPRALLIVLIAIYISIHVASAGDTLTNSQLNTGEELRSNNGFYQLIIQGDCNLVLYRVSDHHALWSSKTYKKAKGCTVSMQADGNLVIYSNQNLAVWSSKTSRGSDRYNLIMQGDGNLVIYTSRQVAIWSTKTNLSAPPPFPDPPTPRVPSVPPFLTPPAPSLSPPSSLATGSKHTTSIVVGAIVGSVALILALVTCYIYCKRKPQKVIRDWDNRKNLQGAVPYSYDELNIATGGFHVSNKLGEGGFGIVYKGVLKCGSEVAVKQLSLQSHQGNQEFVNEITIITGIQHRNLVRLKGYCIEGNQRLLVYEFLHNKSLDHALFDAKDGVLDWPTRYNIILEIARGLAYLHEDSQIQIIHRDIKASNILLDRNLNPKISDFGISKLFNHDGKSFISTRVAGTFGYLAPEYAWRGQLTVKADVFSFGILLLEIVSGRKCNDHTMPAERQVLTEWTWDVYERGNLLDLVDHRLDMKYSDAEALRIIQLALLCTHEDPSSRPSMSDVVAILLGYIDLGPLPSRRPRYFGDVTDNSLPSITIDSCSHY